MTRVAVGGAGANLLDNAVKYSLGGGEIAVMVSVERTDGREWATLSVRDQPREREILTACAEGLSGPNIARRLYLSDGTVRNKVSDVIGKLGARNRAAAVQIATESGWLRPDEPIGPLAPRAQGRSSA